jgi:hypothetical protein
MSREFGDFQTPPGLVREVLACCQREAGRSWKRALEPTCGAGTFIVGLLAMDSPPREIWGVEIQDAHLDVARSLIGHDARSHVDIKHASVFDVNLGADLAWRESGPLLVIGNPPWVTNAELGALGSRNLPAKRNIKGLAGLEAITGAANFDISEYIWLKLLTELAPQEPTIALLCKTAVARNVLQFAWQRGVPVESGCVRRIDAQRWFGASVDACLFVLQLRTGASHYQIPVYADLIATQPSSMMAVENGRLIADLAAYRAASFADGASPIEWRQGVKHDAGAVMELQSDEAGALRNKLGETVSVESEFVFPMLKSSDLSNDRRRPRWMLVPQRKLGEDTRQLEARAPKVWQYLHEHAVAFENRKSSIYRGQPPFAVFGVGDYSFANFKVAISGLHKQPNFRAVGPIDGRPVVFDDTCYFVACQSGEQAALLAALLNSEPSKQLLRALTFTDAKRPMTKALLQRVDVRVLSTVVPRRDLLDPADAYLDQMGRKPPEWPADLEDVLRFRHDPVPQPRLSFG